MTVRARLERTQAVQASSEAKLDTIKQQIVTALGHEMRTPLTYIRGYTELALEDVPSLPPEVLEEFLQGISLGADRLTRLAEDFLALVRLDTGQTEREFRQLVEKFDFSPCGDCNYADACYVLHIPVFPRDCYNRTQPCGDCPWARGILKCL